jgi:hypothetical protein
MTKETKAYKAHQQAIVAGKVTKTNVIGIRKLLNKTHQEARGWGKQRSPLGTIEQADNLLSSLRFNCPLVEGELVETGKQLLRDKRYKKRWSSGQQQMIDNLEGFRLVDFVEIGNSHWYPVYATVGDGEAFKFYNVPWQSGGDGPQIER